MTSLHFSVTIHLIFDCVCKKCVNLSQVEDFRYHNMLWPITSPTIAVTVI